MIMVVGFEATLFIANRLLGPRFRGLQLDNNKPKKVVEETVTVYRKSNPETQAYNRVLSVIRCLTCKQIV